MTIKELYEWSKQHNCSNYEMMYKIFDGEEGINILLDPRIIDDKLRIVSFNDSN